MSAGTAELTAFIVRAKAATWLAGAPPRLAAQPGARELEFQDADWAYLDRYFGSEDFIGQEVVYAHGRPMWVMNYAGRILPGAAYDGARAARVAQPARAGLYGQGRFLGAHTLATPDGIYFNVSQGDLDHFTGRESIELEGAAVYEMLYHGGLVRG